MNVYIESPYGAFGYTIHLSDYNDIIEDVLERFGVSEIFNQTITQCPEYTLYSFETETVEEKIDTKRIAKQADEIISVLKNTKYFKTIVSAATYYNRYNDEIAFRELLWKVIQPQVPLLKQTIRFSMKVYIF